MNIQSVIHFPVAVQHAFKGLKFLSGKSIQESFKIKEIAKSEKLPPHFLGKIFQRLVTANILHSKRGPSGGYSLSKLSEKIYLSEVIVALDGANRGERSCLVGLGMCGKVRACPIHDVMNTAEIKIEERVGKITLKDLFGGVKI